MVKAKKKGRHFHAKFQYKNNYTYKSGNNEVSKGNAQSNKPVMIPKPVKMEMNKKKKRKQHIPLAVRQAVWVEQFGEKFKHKCYVSWCHRMISCFDFEVGHNIPESKGGTLDLNNLLPICHQCNIGMGNQYTITDWSNRKFKLD